MKKLLILAWGCAVLSCKTTLPVATPLPVVDSTTVATPIVLEALQEIVPDVGPYRAERTKHNNLIHTKLEVRFDWSKQHLLGKATLELKPHFYDQDKLTLDAKGFDIHAVSLLDGSNKQPLTYEYDPLHIHIQLDRKYTRDESYFIEIEYTAKPNELDAGGSTAITSDKGLYFINPLGEDPNKPQQIWTQGETEASSCWFPTIDNPNQRTTQEIYITIEDRFKTLSNGKLIYARSNGDGTRTDYWKMDQPHAPYLFMMAIGEYAIVKQQWNDKDVTYYVEPEYEKYALNIFGKTPEMIAYFSELLDYPYPWSKYAQVVVRDYVSGAMENTTASVFMDDLQVDDRYLLDEDWDGIIAHELIHQWFGDLVTCESWSNLTLNEAFATYAEYLWVEHESGREAADYKGYEEQLNYLAESEQKQVDLIRFYYEDKEDMFDSHSYAKGSRVLNMLRHLVGDEAFFASLNLYLKENAYQSVEVHHLRLAFEKVTGQDLNWFFNQWFLSPGHPMLNVAKTYENDSIYLEVTQQQDLSTTPIYRLPITIEIWSGGQKEEHTIVVDQVQQQFAFHSSTAADFVVFDSKSQLLGEVSFVKSKTELAKQYRMSTHALVRINALESLLADSVADDTMVEIMVEALEDKFWSIRQLAANVFEEYQGAYSDQVAKMLQTIATSDPKTIVKADAITTLSSFANSDDYQEIYREAMKAPSYAVAGAGLTAYLQTDATDKDEALSKFKNEENINLILPLADYYALKSVAGKYTWFTDRLANGQGELMYYLVNYFGQYLLNSLEIDQVSGAKYLEQIGINHPAYYVRFSAFQALSLLEDVPGVAEMKQRVRGQEKDPRLLEVYEQMP